MGALTQCTKANEDVGASKLQAQAVGANQNQISDAQLDQLNMGNGLSQKLMLTFACKSLPNLDVGSKTDPFCVVWELKGNQKIKRGQTECILDNLNPEFVTAIEVDYRFEESQNFQLDVYDADDMNQLQNLSKQELVGSQKFTLHGLVTKPNQTETFQLEHMLIKSNRGQVKIQAQEKRADYGQTECQFDMTITQCGSYGSSSLFIMLYRTNPNGSTQPVYKSENQKLFNGQFKFGRVFSDTDTLANGQEQQDIWVKIFQFHNSGTHKCVCSQKIQLNQLTIAGVEQQELKLSQSNMSIKIDKVIVQKRVTFLDYIFGGCEISLQVAIDFTASNGAPSNPQSLHFMGQTGVPNQYVAAIQSVGSILEQYDTDKRYPVYGFGGRMAENPTATSHCFALNGDIFRPEVPGVQGILNVYQHAIQRASLHGPTFFSPILNYVNGYCQQKAMETSQYNQQYTILLILTDGAIMDMQNSIDAIVAASGLPLSIVIVGVGSADFSSMETLDADEAPLYSQAFRTYQTRDIVQFVPFLKYSRDAAMLAKEVLREIPGQLVQYFQTMRISPNMPNAGMSKMANILGGALVNQVKQGEQYFDVQKNMLLQQASQSGMDPAQAQAFLDTVGLAEINVQSLFRLANAPNYVNQLRYIQ